MDSNNTYSSLSTKIPHDVIDYNQTAYINYYKKGYEAEFNSGPLAKGPIDSKIINGVLSELNTKSQQETHVIKFNSERVEMVLEGGSCSAISLKVGKVAVTCFETSSNCELLTKLKKVIAEINKLPSSKRKSFRAVQAAYNTIEVDTTQKVDDYAREKIKALAAYEHLKVSTSSETIKIENSENCEDQFKKITSCLEPGVYLTRVIVDANNHKLEEVGHSTIYIKRQEGEWYFDPQLGLWDLAQAHRENERYFIYHAMCSAEKKFKVNSCKFHKLENKV